MLTRDERTLIAWLVGPDLVPIPREVREALGRVQVTINPEGTAARLVSREPGAPRKGGWFRRLAGGGHGGRGCPPDATV